MEEKVSLSRGLSLCHLMMMGMGMMIGAGVFVATGISIGFAGSGGILVAFALNGLIALFSAMSFAELASALPTAGGAYTYIDEAFKGLVGFLSGWINWFALIVAGSLYAMTFATYTIFLLKETPLFSFFHIAPSTAEEILVIAVALFFIAINYKGVSETGDVENIITIGQMSTLLFIGIFAIFFTLLHPERLSHFSEFIPNGWGKVLMAMGFTYVGFEGYEVIAHAGEEAINPKETIPKAILYSVVAVTTTYLLFAFAAVVGINADSLHISETFAALGPIGMGQAIKDLMPYGGVLVTLAAIFSSTSALNATIYSSTRVAFAMSRDRKLPSILSRIHGTRRVPHYALFVSSIILLGVTVMLPIKDVAASADIVFLLIFLFVNAAAIKIRVERGDELDYSFLMPYFPYIPLFAIFLQLILSIWIFHVSPIAWAITGLWIAVGLLLYVAYGRKGERKEFEREVVFEEVSEKRYRVLAAIANPKNAENIVGYAEKVAEYKGGELILLNVVTVPEQTPIEEAKRFEPEALKLIRSVKDKLKIKNVEGAVYYAHNLVRGILSAVRDYKVDILVLGWKGRPRWRYVLGSHLDKIVWSAPCDVILVKPEKVEKIRKILLPSNGGVHSVMAAEIAEILSKAYNAQVTVLNVNVNNEDEDRIKRRLSHVLERLSRDTIKILEGRNIVDTVIKEAKDYDLVIIGATNEGILQRLLFGGIPEEIARRCNKPVILVKRDLGIMSWINRWIGKRIGV